MPATGPKNISIPQIKAALRKNAAVLTLAARDLGCDRSNIVKRIERTPELQDLVAQIEQEVGDAAEAVIKNKILAGDGETARWYARYKLRDRGYSQRIEQTGVNGAAIAQTVDVRISYVDAPAADDDGVPV